MAELYVIDGSGGASLEDLLFDRGVEFPCGGYSLCGGCRIRVVEGDIPITPDMREVLTDEELAQGWRLACQSTVTGRVVLDIAQWDAPILSDETILRFEPRVGFGIAVDLGTTTLVAQLLNLETGEIVDVRTAINPQTVHGADVMSRIQFELNHPGVLRHFIRESLGLMAADLAGGRDIREVLICGNTVMHHLFCGIDVEPLSHVPFDPDELGARDFSACELGWQLNSCCRVEFLPCLGGFVGSDILAGIVAVSLMKSGRLIALIDLGTNGEIVLGNRDGAICASTAAGPAFEAGRIQMGMRAAHGAISRVTASNSHFDCHVIGGGEARGICGSGLVDAVSAGLDVGSIMMSGRFSNGARQLSLTHSVALTQSDIRELQLAKGAIAAGLNILLLRWGASLADIDRVYLAGAFGNYVSVASANRIGLLSVDAQRVEPAGNTALRGVKILLGTPSQRDRIIQGIRSNTWHVSLASDEHFQDTFVSCLPFP